MVRQIMAASLTAIALGLVLQVAAGANTTSQDPPVTDGPRRTQGSGTR